MIITVANQKGGVGKTTTAVTLAHGLACDYGARVLLIDLDTQGNCSDALGIEKAGSLLEWLLLDRTIAQVAVTARANLNVIRSDKSTVKLKLSLSGMDFREKVLSVALRGYKDLYDVVIIDCAPSVDVLHMAAMVAADLLIIPTKLDQFSVEGVVETVRSMKTVQEMTNSRIDLAGIIPTFYDRVTNESHSQLEALVKAFSSYVWPVIPQDTTCREGSRLGRTIWELKTDGKAADGYRKCMEKLAGMK